MSWRVSPEFVRRAFTSGGGDGFFRPIGNVWLAFDATWLAVSSRAWHAIGLSFHAANTVLVYVLSRVLRVSSVGAALASLVFAVHGTRPEAVVWVAARFDLLATMFLLGALILFGLYLRRSAAWLLAAAAVLGMAGALCKESAYVLPIAAAVVLVWMRENRRARVRDWLLLCLPQAVAFVYRWQMVHGIGGYLGHVDRQPTILNVNLVLIAKLLFWRLWAILVLPLNWNATPSVLTAIAILVYVPALIGFALWTQRSREFWCAVGLIGVMILPVMHLSLLSPDLSGGRFYYLPVVGFGLMLGTLLDRSWRPAALACAGIIVGFQILALEQNLTVWREVGTLTATTCRDVSDVAAGTPGSVIVRNLPSQIRGVHFLHNGLSECVAQMAGGRETRVVLEDGPIGSQTGTRLEWSSRENRLVRLP